MREQRENGNVLFLILIAVVLFSALSYAVTHSTLSTPANPGDEDGNINSAQISQYPTFVRSQILRMLMNNVEVSQLEFNPPSDFANLSAPKFGVFHPSFGATFANAPPEIMANGSTGQWFFNMHFEIKSIGTSQSGNSNGNDLIAFLPGIQQNICLRINELFNLSAIPTVSNASYYNDARELMDHAYIPPGGETVIGDTELTQLEGEPFGCYQETASSNQYIYYFALYER